MTYLYTLFLFSSIVLAQEPLEMSESSEDGDSGEGSDESRPGDVDTKVDMSSQSMEQKGFVAPY